MSPPSPDLTRIPRRPVGEPPILRGPNDQDTSEIDTHRNNKVDPKPLSDTNYSSRNLSSEVNESLLSGRESTQESSTEQSDIIEQVDATEQANSTGQATSKHKHAFLALLPKYTTDWWLLEIIMWLISALSLVAICITLKVHDGQSLPQWPWSITVNGLVSVFTTISEISLLFVVVECIGQLKWTWFSHNGRNLADFQAFDRASRGSWGGLQLLQLQKLRHLASLGAIITIIALPVSPITQQTINYGQHSVVVKNQTATIPQARQYLHPDFSDGPNRDNQVKIFLPSGVIADIPLVHTSTRGAIYNSLYTPINQTIPRITPTCTSGNCTWPSYRNLGVCSQRANITQFLTTKCDNKNCTQSLPNGVSVQNDTSLSITSLSMYQDPTYDGRVSLGLSNIQWPIVDVFVIYNNVAFEFALYYCVQEWNTTTINGQSSSILTGNWSISNSQLRDIENETESPAYLLTAPNDPTTYNVSSQAMIALTTFAGSVLTGTYTPPKNGSDGQIYSTETARVLAALVNTHNEVSTAFGNIMDNTAVSLSNNFQQYSEPNQLVVGQNTIDQTYVNVIWGWLTLLILLVVLSLIFLIFTILNSSRHKSQVWKNSSLASLQALDSEVCTELGALNRISELDHLAGKIIVTLEEQDDSGWKLAKVLKQA